MPFVFVDEPHVKRLAEALREGRSPYDRVRDLVRRGAEEAYDLGPWSVTHYPSPAASGDPNDYYSESTYWWPDPDNPSGEWIRRDGEANPFRFMDHTKAMRQLSQAVMALSFGGFYLEEPAWAERAAELLRVWFLDEETRMNPHLEYAQAIPGRIEGRAIGIIDTNCLIGLVHALPFLERTGRWPQDQVEGVKAWFRQYLTWLTTSEKGLEEKRLRNNHGTYWAVQTGSYATYVGESAIAGEAIRRYGERLLHVQVNPDGRQPREEERTRSLTYSIMNANGLALLCELAHRHGVDLWRYESDGLSIGLVAAYLAPFVEDPSRWTAPQITPVDPSPQLFLQLAGLRLGEPRYNAINRQKEAEQGELGASLIGPLALLPGWSAF